MIRGQLTQHNGAVMPQTSIGCGSMSRTEHENEQKIQDDFTSTRGDIIEKTKVAGDRGVVKMTDKLLEKAEVRATCSDRSNEMADHIILNTERKSNAPTELPVCPDEMKFTSCPAKKKRRKKLKVRDIPVDGRGTSFSDIATNCELEEDEPKAMNEGNRPPTTIECQKSITRNDACTELPVCPNETKPISCPAEKKRRKKLKVRDIPVDGRGTSFSDIATDCALKKDTPKTMDEGSCPPTITRCQKSITGKVSNESLQPIIGMCQSRKRENKKKRKAGNQENHCDSNGLSELEIEKQSSLASLNEINESKEKIHNDSISTSGEIIEKTRAAGERSKDKIADELQEKTEVYSPCADGSNKKADHAMLSTEQERNACTGLSVCPAEMKSISCPAGKKRRKKLKVRDITVDGRGTNFSDIATNCALEKDQPKAMNDGNCPLTTIECQKSIARKASNTSPQPITEMRHSREKKNKKKRKIENQENGSDSKLEMRALASPKEINESATSPQICAFSDEWLWMPW